jgi:nitrogen regulatory protein P-II 1
MKKIEAIIKPFRLEPVNEAMHDISLQGIMVHRSQRVRTVEGHSPISFCKPQSGHALHFAILTPFGKNLPNKYIHHIKALANLGNGHGDCNHVPGESHTTESWVGKIFVYPVAEVIRIRTGEKGDEAV